MPVVTVALLIGGCCRQQLPALLVGARAGGGFYSACPPRNETERQLADGTQLAISPELTQRLAERFPPGSPTEPLVELLTTQGYRVIEPCDSDRSVRRASYFQEGCGFLGYDTDSTVYWKEDEEGCVVWTKGFVRFIGL